MCRITGIIDTSSSNLNNDCIAMRDAMHRGGPDQAGFFNDEDAALALGFRRLSIIDLCETGNQPMFNAGNNVVIIFNGEIYNYLQLKDELKKEGFSFKSTSDTEVILNAYLHWGKDCFSKLRGMFGIAIYDKRAGELILARDHAGIKPLYYYCDGNKLYFASEIRAFKNLNKQWEEDSSWKVYLLTYGYLPANVTTLKGVKPLEKGSFKVFDVKTLQSKQVYFFRDNYTEEITDVEEAKGLIRSTLEKAVERHMIADAPIGLFLSGGIDSSLLTLLAKNYKKDLHTLSIVFDDKNFSEREYQEIISKKVGSHHQSFVLNKEIFLTALPDIFDAMDQPSSDGINSYFISKFAKEAGLKAVLSGLGADELFGGYSSFKRSGLLKKLKLLPNYIYDLASLMPQDKYKKINFLNTNNSIGDYLFNRGYYTPLETAKLLNMDVAEVKRSLQSIELPHYINNLSEGNKTSFLESNLYMENQLLKDTDVMSMWHSVEVRVPFLDHDFIVAAQKISSHLKFDNKIGKYLLIESFKDILPEEIWNRKKQGFVFPFQVWMQDSLDHFTQHNNGNDLHKKFKAGNLSWSRYWTFLVSQTFKA